MTKQNFKDAKGKAWHLNLTIGIAKKIKRQLGIDLLEGDPGVLIQTLYDEPYQRLEMLWLMCENEGSTQEEFDNALNAESLKEAIAAFWGAVENFIQAVNPNRAKAIQELVKKYSEMTQKQTELILELASSQEAQAAMDKALEQARQDSFGKLSTLAEDSLGS